MKDFLIWIISVTLVVPGVLIVGNHLEISNAPDYVVSTLFYLAILASACTTLVVRDIIKR